MDPPTADSAAMKLERAVMLRDIAAGGADRSLAPTDEKEPKIGPPLGGANVVRPGRTASKGRRSRGEDRGPKYPSTLPAKRSNLKADLDEVAGHGSRPRVGDAPYFPSDIGLLINDTVRIYSNLPTLSLSIPRAVEANERLHAPDVDLDLVAHGSLLEDLRKLVEQLRKTPQDAHHDGRRLLGSAFSDKYSLMLDRSRGTTHWDIGSTPTPRQFVAFLTSTMHPNAPVDVTASITAQLQHSGRIVLSHSELSPKNIIVNNGVIVSIIGWDYGGWYPEWWDYVKFFEAGTKLHDWHSYADEIFEKKFRQELVAYQALMRCHTS
ncbi:phosphotransferase enzyme family protein [Hirsutella rhossiliensis]|uniref:Phosphotransferase enzyme family protein n=1 Tax=Hirsutella rhossiliensis TaxID=111463 RepID=A0A9P8SPG3_9HYPO|nr:phosphotransferase enzyme family protein [Hirsutella rhossiliensis]KAH0968181.1 phosphotransferase enzyme family protein [Hirsutella rhossiliensis]